MAEESYDAIVIGGGQAGLATGYELRRRGLRFVILDAHARVGDAWRTRWNSLRLFTPARYDGLPGMRFPAPGFSFPTKDEMADFLESYATRFDLPVRTGARVTRLARLNGGYEVAAGAARFSAPHVVVAMSNFQQPRVPEFARQLAPGITQITAADYRDPAQVRPGAVLIVGAGNSGAEIALDLVPTHPVWLAGREVGQIPFRIESWASRLLVPLIFRVLFHRVLTVRTPMGRRARVKMLTTGGPLIRTKRSDLAAAGVQRVPRVAAVRDGKPVLADGLVLDVANVVWCAGFDAGFSWIALDVHGELGPRHESGIVPTEPGLYFVGLMFLHAGSSAMVHGVGRDAARIADTIAGRLGRR